jgi:hypothetical protein
MDLGIADRKAIVILSHVLNADTINEIWYKQFETTSDSRRMDWFALKTANS